MPSNSLSERAVFARVSRRLNREGLFLHRCPFNSRYFSELGRYYETNERNHICGTRWLTSKIDLLDYAKELGVVDQGAEMAEE